MLTVIACPLTTSGATVLSEFLQTLQSSSPVVTADSRATARLIINACAAPPDAATVSALSQLQRRRYP
jgi:UDP-N-acetylglucosamine enolpyruvyl transferase